MKSLFHSNQCCRSEDIIFYSKSTTSEIIIFWEVTKQLVCATADAVSMHADMKRIRVFVVVVVVVVVVFEHNRTPSGKKTVTGVQVITASQDWS